MRFLIENKYFDVTKRELEMMKYSVSAIDAEDDKVIVNTDAGEEECRSSVCRAYLESLGEVDSFIPVSEEESENARFIGRLRRETGRKSFTIYGKREAIVLETGFKILEN